MEAEVRAADFGIERSVCETLAAKAPESLPEKSLILDMLVTAAHAPQLSAEERRVLYRVADLLHVSWTRIWERTQAPAASADGLIEIRCYVPHSSEEQWERMLAQAELNARMCGLAATSLRYLLTNLSEDARLERTRAWIQQAQSCLTTTGQNLRKMQMPPSEAECA